MPNPDPLPFEFPRRWRTIATDTLSAKDRAVLEQRDKELEDFLAKLFRRPTGSGSAGVAVRYAAGQQLIGTGFNTVFWNLLLHNTEGYDAYVAVEAGETNDRIHFYTAGIYEVDWEVYSNDVDTTAMPGTIQADMTLVDPDGNELPQGQGRSISHDNETGDSGDTGTSIATGSHTVAAEVDDYLNLWARSTGGTGVDIVAYVSIHYIGPTGYRLPFEES